MKSEQKGVKEKRDSDLQIRLIRAEIAYNGKSIELQDKVWQIRMQGENLTETQKMEPSINQLRSINIQKLFPAHFFLKEDEEYLYTFRDDHSNIVHSVEIRRVRKTEETACLLEEIKEYLVQTHDDFMN